MQNAVLLDVLHVLVVRSNVSEESIASVIKVARIGKPGTNLSVTKN
jgi:hypothetical protein